LVGGEDADGAHDVRVALSLKDEIDDVILEVGHRLVDAGDVGRGNVIPVGFSSCVMPESESVDRGADVRLEILLVASVFP